MADPLWPNPVVDDSHRQMRVITTGDHVFIITLYQRVPEDEACVHFKVWRRSPLGHVQSKVSDSKYLKWAGSEMYYGPGIDEYDKAFVSIIDARAYVHQLLEELEGITPGGNDDQAAVARPD